MNTIKEIQQLNEEELKRGISFKASWHWQYRASSWVYVGGLDQRLSIGDVICVFSQLGEIEDAHLVADEESGASKGFAFLKYEDFRSAVLAVDNMNGASLLGRTLRVDHKLDYTPPKKKEEDDSGAAAAGADGTTGWAAGEAYRDAELANGFSLSTGVDVFGGGSQGGAAVPMSALVGSHGRLAAAGGTTDWRRPSVTPTSPSGGIATGSATHGLSGHMTQNITTHIAMAAEKEEEEEADRSTHRHRRHRSRRHTGDDDESRASRDGDRHRRRRFHRRRDGDEEDDDNDDDIDEGGRGGDGDRSRRRSSSSSSSRRRRGRNDSLTRDRSSRSRHHRDEDRGRRGGGRVKFRGAMPEDLHTAGPADAEELMRKTDK